MKTRIFKITTETPDNRKWRSLNVVAPTAEKAIAKAAKSFCPELDERLLNIELLASED